MFYRCSTTFGNWWKVVMVLHCPILDYFPKTAHPWVFFICCISVPRSSTHCKWSEPNNLPYCSHFLKVLDMTTHEVGSGSHEEVHHLSGKDRNEWVLPAQRVDEQHKALSHQREPGPVWGEEHDPLLRQDTADHLKMHAEFLVMDSRHNNSAYWQLLMHQCIRSNQLSSMHTEYQIHITFYFFHYILLLFFFLNPINILCADRPVRSDWVESTERADAGPGPQQDDTRLL